MAGWTIVVASVVVVLGGFETIAGLDSLSAREEIEKFLAQPPGSDLGLGVDGVREFIRVATMIAAGCATAAAILGYQVLRRNRTARIALSVLAVPLFVAGIATGAFFSSLVAAAAGMLWLSPAREWFAGTWRPPTAGELRGRRDREEREPPSLPPLPPLPPGPPTSPPQAGSPPGGPPQAGLPPGGPLPGRPPAYPPPWQGYAAPPGPWRPPVPQHRELPRPTSVTFACLLSWVFGALSLVVSFASVSMMLVGRESLLRQLHRQNPELFADGLTDDTVVTLTLVLGGVMTVWSLVVLALASFAFAQRGWARLALTVSAGVAAALSLVLVGLGQGIMLLPLAASIATVVGLLRSDARAWFAQRPRPPRGGHGGIAA